MKKCVIRTLLLAGFSLVCISGGTYAYLTSFDEAVNPVGIGYQTSTIVEEFPTPSPVNPEEDPEIKKTVAIQNENTPGNVDCFIRAKILTSNSDLGNLVIYHDLDTTNWVAYPDGYYYYQKTVKPGEQTTPLFTSFTLDHTRAQKESYQYAKDFSLTIYEESIQADGILDWKTSWESFLHYTLSRGGTS